MNFRLPVGVYRVQALILVVVFALFLGNAMGLLSFPLHLSGFRLHTRFLDDLTRGTVPAHLLRFDFLCFFLIGAMLAVGLPRLSPIAASMLTLTAMVPPFYIAWAAPVPPPGVPLEYTLLVILVLFAVNVLMSYYIETHTRQKILSAFGQYVPPTLVGQISRRPEAFSMAGEARDLSVMFCDVRGFSAIAELLEPRDLAALLNHYLTAMTDVLHRHDGTIDKYIGDAVMAFWGAPLAQADHARRAVTAALDMQRAMTAVRADCRRRGWPQMDIGIGVNSGVMRVGNMGSRYRVAYTVLGDAVNVAARLETLTRVYDAAILISDTTRAGCPEVPCREIDHVRVKGRDRATRIYEPLADYTTAAAYAERHHTALAAYYAGDWAAAETLFAELETATPHAGYYAVMRARMRQQLPPEGWRGVISFGSSFSYSLDGSGGGGSAA